MKLAVTVSRVIVGLLFIFSGLVKANDPLGLSYKMQEFFDLWGMSQFNSLTLGFSILIIAFEIIAGAALLLGWQMRLFSWLLLLLIIFFTFLTGYAYLSGKFKNCGCFGDCIPISAKASFIKDILLAILIGFLFWKRGLVKPLLSRRATFISMAAVTLFSFGIQWYTLTYLPVADCLPFKTGNSMPEKMKMPANAIPDSTIITFVYEKEGKQVEFTADKFPADFNATTYKFISRYDKIVRKGKNNEPPIKGFALTGISNVDSTSVVLSQPTAFLLFCENFSKPVSAWEDDFAKLYAVASEKNIPLYLVTSQPSEAVKAVAGTPFRSIQVFKCDYTAIRTAARTNPELYLLKEGTIVDKWSYKNLTEAVEIIDNKQ